MAHSMHVYMYYTIHRQILHVLKSIVHLGTPMSVYEVCVTALVRQHLRNPTCMPNHLSDIFLQTHCFRQ